MLTVLTESRCSVGTMKGERVVGYDINFHAPKSLSLLYALTQDAEILKAFRSSVAETMNVVFSSGSLVTVTSNSITVSASAGGMPARSPAC